MHRLSLQMVVFGVMLAGSAQTDAQSRSSVSTTTRAVCQSGGADANAVDSWRRVRAALSAASASRDSALPTLHVIRYDRLLDASNKRVEQQTLIDSTIRAADDLPIRASAGDYAALGYRDSGTSSVSERFFVPSVAALLDSSFARTHCITQLADDADHPGETGIAFAPAAGDRTTLDVSGAIRIARDTALLHAIDIVYVGAALPRGASAWGGTIQYDTIAHGRVLATRWALHIPAVVRRVVTDGAALVAPAGNGGGVREVGGEIASATWADGSRWDAELPALRGRVVAAGSHAPLSGVEVELRGTSFQSRTDSSGAFHFPPIVPGPYALDALDVGLSEFGVSSAATAVILVGRVRTPPPITLVMRSRSAMIDSLCADNWEANPGVPLGSALLVGHVTLPSGAPAAGAMVRAFWTGYSGGDTIPVRLGGRADSTGTFQMCGMPTSTPVRLTATRDSLVSIDTTVSAQNDGDIRRVTIPLTGLRDPRLGAYRHRYLEVTGIDSMPLAGVDVNDVFGTSVGRTTANGRMALGAVSEGNVLLKLRKLGYEQRSLMVAISPSDTTPVRVQLRTATQLAAVKITAQVTMSQLALRSGVEERMKQGFGRFFGPAEIMKNRHLALDVSLSALGLRVLPLSDFLPGGIGGGAGEVLVGGHSIGRCPVTIYVDGLLYYEQRPGAGPPPDATLWTTGDFAAAEYYADESLAPPQFVHATGGQDFCGVLMLWSRDG